jgi:ABC-2 type transport system permease protein
LIDTVIRIGNLVGKEMIQFRRDWILTLFILLAPALQLVLLAHNVEQGIINEPVAIVDHDRSVDSRQLAVDLDNTEELRVAHYVGSMDEAQRLLEQGKVRLVVVIPAGLAREMNTVQQQNPGTEVGIIADASNSLAASVTMNAATGAVNRFAAARAALNSLVTAELIDFRIDVRFNPTMDFRDFSIPAQLGFITYQVTLAVASLGLARERELGTLEQLMVSPLRRLELAVGKGLPAMVVGILNFVVMWIIGLLLFQVPMNGSMALLVFLTVIFVTTVVNWGLVISAVSRTQQQAILLVFILAMVEITFSGFMVPIDNMPPLLQAIARFAPLQHYLIIIRSIMLKGAGLQELLPQVVALAALNVVLGMVSIGIVTRRLE